MHVACYPRDAVLARARGYCSCGRDATVTPKYIYGHIYTLVTPQAVTDVVAYLQQ